MINNSNLNKNLIYWEQIIQNPSKLRLLRSPSSPIEGSNQTTTTTNNSSSSWNYNQVSRHPSQHSVGVHSAWKHSASPRFFSNLGY
jgi:hypothetical protein